jgi:hypothetical protein
MKRIRLFTIILQLVSISLLSACEEKSYSTSTLTSTPLPTISPTSTFTPTAIPTAMPIVKPTLTATPTSNPNPMTCESAGVVNAGEYQAIVGDWGKGTLTGWSQCISASIDPDGALAGRWTWNWLNSGTNVKAFPAIVYGQVPSSISTTTSLPVIINSIDSAIVSYNVTSTHTGTGNLILHMWLTNTQNPTTWGVPPITHEIIIVLEVYGEMYPAVPTIKQVVIDEISYDLSTGDNFGMGWRFIVFTRIPYQQGSGALNLIPFFSTIKKEGLITGNEYLASISIGNEIVSGIGETNLKDYFITIKQK